MIVCADDFGISSAVSWDILDLIKLKRISATSCMVVGAESSHTAFKELRNYDHAVDVGLHLTLSGRQLINPRPEIEEQILLFKNIFGFWPRHIDGHRHVQQLPVVRPALIAECSRLITTPFYMRHGGLPLRALWQTKVSWSAKLGSAFIAMPARKFKDQLDQAQIPTTQSLWGYYDLERDKFKKVFLEYSLQATHPNDVLFVHPGRVDQELKSKDRLTTPREEVSAFLRSDAYVAILERGCAFNRFQFAPCAHPNFDEYTPSDTLRERQ